MNQGLAEWIWIPRDESVPRKTHQGSAGRIRVHGTDQDPLGTDQGPPDLGITNFELRP